MHWTPQILCYFSGGGACQSETLCSFYRLHLPSIKPADNPGWCVNTAEDDASSTWQWENKKETKICRWKTNLEDTDEDVNRVWGAAPGCSTSRLKRGLLVAHIGQTSAGRLAAIVPGGTWAECGPQPGQGNIVFICQWIFSVFQVMLYPSIKKSRTTGFGWVSWRRFTSR